MKVNTGKSNLLISRNVRATAKIDNNYIMITMKSFVTSQFGYCPLIWIFDSRYYNNKTNFIQESAVNIIYQGHIFTFHKLLNNDNSVSMHHRNLQVLAAEMIECHKGLSPDILRETFVLKKRWYNLRRNNTF